MKYSREEHLRAAEAFEHAAREASEPEQKKRLEDNARRRRLLAKLASPPVNEGKRPRSAPVTKPSPPQESLIPQDASMLTDSEIRSLRKDAKEALDYLRRRRLARKSKEL